MKFIDYIEEKIWFIIFQVTVAFLISIYFKLFGLPNKSLIILDFIWSFITVAYVVISYLIEKKEYENIVSIVDKLDEKYLKIRPIIMH